MTVIECFERNPIENIATALSLNPDKLVFMGTEEKLEGKLGKYKGFLNIRKPGMQVCPCYVDENDTLGAANLIEDIIKTSDKCIIDLAGGDEFILAAAGMAYERCKDKYSVSLRYIDVDTGDMDDCDGNLIFEQLFQPSITIKELISLYGGCIVKATSLSDEHNSKYIDKIWDLSIEYGKAWNDATNTVKTFEKHAEKYNNNSLLITINLHRIKNSIQNFSEREITFKNLINSLEKIGIIKVMCRAPQKFQYRYKNSFCFELLKSAGNILEYKIFSLAGELQQDGKQVFTDCLRSVLIDWDGIIHPNVKGGIKDTKNEIDVMLIHKLKPIFISCKNGDVEDEELYKLNTVAERFGGIDAKKVLIATNYNPENPDEKRSLEQRAKDMGVYIITNGSTLTKSDWHEILLNIIKPTS